MELVAVAAEPARRDPRRNLTRTAPHGVPDGRALGSGHRRRDPDSPALTTACDRWTPGRRDAGTYPEHVGRARHRSGAQVNGIGEGPGQLVGTRREGHVLIISLQRAAKRNAIDRAMADALDAALNELEDDEDLWVGVLAGTTDVFSAGSDLTAGGDYLTERGGEYGIIRRPRGTPLIAAVEGPALGGGLEIVLACDLVVASSTARFGLPEVGIGVVPTCAGLFRTPRALPLNIARQLILTGRPIDARRAYEVGFVNVLSEPGDALAGALGLAREICANAPVSVRACLRAVNNVTAADDEFGWQETSGALAAASASADAREGVAAFLEKRPPVWTGR